MRTWCWVCYHYVNSTCTVWSVNISARGYNRIVLLRAHETDGLDIVFFPNNPWHILVDSLKSIKVVICGKYKNRNKITRI